MEAEESTFRPGLSLVISLFQGRHSSVSGELSASRSIYSSDTEDTLGHVTDTKSGRSVKQEDTPSQSKPLAFHHPHGPSECRQLKRQDFQIDPTWKDSRYLLSYSFSCPKSFGRTEYAMFLHLKPAAPIVQEAPQNEKPGQFVPNRR